MDHPSRSMEVSSGESDMDCGGPDQVVLEGKTIIGLETILVLFWQRMWVLFAFVLKICLS